VTAALGPLLALASLAAGLAAFLRLPPRKALAALVFSVAAALACLRQFALAVPVAMVAASLWQRAGSGGGARSPGGQSRARSDRLAMTLDHDTGEMDGQVLEGGFAGRLLSELSAAELQALRAEIVTAEDEDSLVLLDAWLDRTGAAREESPEAEAPAPGGGPMSEADALRILGLAPGATLDDIRAAHRRLIKRVHPDLGGSDALAAMINAAKARLDPG
jgi:membrane protein implicated in regulation of membrane protease activity